MINFSDFSEMLDSFLHDVSSASPSGSLYTFGCHCGRHFSTSQGLALHRLKAHGEHAPEHDYVEGATCPICMQFLWTSNRLALHLAYAPRDGTPNPCFAALERAGVVPRQGPQQAPRALVGAARMDALPAAGPAQLLLPSRYMRQCATIDAELRILEAQLTIAPLPDHPDHHAQHLRRALSACTQRWLEAAQRPTPPSDQPELLSFWFRLMSVYDDFEQWVSQLFFDWGAQELQEIVANLFDGELEYVLQDQFAEARALLPRADLQTRAIQLSTINDDFVKKMNYDLHSLIAPSGEAPPMCRSALQLAIRCRCLFIFSLPGIDNFARFNGVISRRTVGSPYWLALGDNSLCWLRISFRVGVVLVTSTGA